ncbi:outer membrane protein [Roseateles sp. P5_E7]
MKRVVLIAGALCSAGAALAQDADLSVSAGLRAWNTDWTTFTYAPSGTGRVLKQVTASAKTALMPSVSVRYGAFRGTLSALTSTSYGFDDNTSGKRSEFDANLAYSVLPGLALTLGYKGMTQSGNSGSYRPSGPVLGVSASAPIGEGLAIYGSLGLGRLKTRSGDNIQFKAEYGLTEVGLTYALTTDQPRWTLTGGYRMQVLRSKDALPETGQDGRDNTQGFTLGVLVSF